MKVSDYIVQTLKQHQIIHYFGYQGTMIAHFVDSIGKDADAVNHTCYNEQAAALAACGQAKVTGQCTVAYATSGPGAMNLLSGIADAYYDSVPVLFITGQVNTYEYTGIEGLKQHSFQEADVVSMAKPVTKFAVKIEKEQDVPHYLEMALKIAMEGRKGPVLLDIPMNIQRGEVDAEPKAVIFKKAVSGCQEIAEHIAKALNAAKRPLLLLGNGLDKSPEAREAIRKCVEQLQVPVITSMLGRDLLPWESPLNFGYIGAAYGHRYANFLAYKKADLIVSLGCSVCRRQTGMNTEKFAENAHIIRVDIDPIELQRRVHQNEESFLADATEVMRHLGSKACAAKEEWLQVCRDVKARLHSVDLNDEYRYPNRFMEVLSRHADEDAVFLCDVGQHQIWGAQSLQVKGNQRILFSGGHGAMGFALPAAIGAQYATQKRTYAICGDGALQMNIQELQWLVRENLNVTVIAMNNQSLGLIQQQQDDFFDGKHYGATAQGGFVSPEFAKIAAAYGMESHQVRTPEEFEQLFNDAEKQGPVMIEVVMQDGTKAYPKTYFGEEMYNQRPYAPEGLMEDLLTL